MHSKIPKRLFWSIFKCVYVCVCLQKQFLSLWVKRLQLFIYFPDRADCNFQFCNAEDETQMKDGYSKQTIDSRKKQTFPAESVVGISVSPASGYQTTHESESKATTKSDNCFLCLWGKIQELHDALWLKGELHSQIHGYSITATIAQTYTLWLNQKNRLCETSFVFLV